MNQSRLLYLTYDDNEAWSPAPPPPRFARYASSSGPPAPLARGRRVRAIPSSQRDPHRSYVSGQLRIERISLPIHHSPLAFVFPQKEGEAERRQTLIRILRILRCGSRLMKARSSDGVPPRLSPKGIIPSQRLGFRPGFLGRGLHGRYPPSPVPVQGCTSHPGHNAGRHDAQAAREQHAKPPAGTAPAPPFGLPPEGVLRESGIFTV